MSLAALLEQAAGFAPEYRGGLSNHLPMALLALYRLGATDSRLQAFASAYARRLEPAPAEEPWPAGDAWPGRFGDRAAWPAYRSLFTEWMVFEGAVPVLQQVLPVLMPGCGAAAFHGMIRTACAVQSGQERELADALAYWSCRFLPLGPLPADAGRQPDPEVLLRRLHAGQSEARLIVGRMHDASRDGRLHAEVARLAVEPLTLQRLARLAARAYAGSGSFTALHLVTASHAMRLLSPFFDDCSFAWRWFWQAYATAVVAAGLKAAPEPPMLPWESLIEAAVEADDEHLVKLVWSCREEEETYDGDDWRRAASRAIAGRPAG